MDNSLKLYWRVGRKLGRTIYAVEFDDPDGPGILLGMMDSREIAERVVADHNRVLLQEARG
jgi:hypothetical protein